MMEKKNLKKGAWAAGGVALLAVASALCVKGMKVVDQRMKAKKEAEAAFDEAELFEDAVEVESAEEPVEESVEEIAEESAQQDWE